MEETLRETLDGDRRWILSHYPQLEVQTELVQGSAVDALAQASEKSQRVVIGTKGRGGFSRRLLGSTTQGLIRHSRSPLLCVPHKEDERIQDRKKFPGLAEDEFTEN